MSLLSNLILNTDSYKCSHYCQYPPGTEQISSYIESRGGIYPHVVFFGLQMFIKQYLLTPITLQDIDQAQALVQAHGLPFYREGWEYIVKQHGGLLPMAIEAVAEGSVVPVSNVLLQVINTDPKCFWLTSYIETALLRAIWYPSTVATTSWQAKRILKRYLSETADDLSGLPFKLHDFGARGATSLESSAIGACAHLVNFQGSDTVAGIVAAREYYGEDMAAFSIPAAEHSTVTSWGKDQEAQAYANLLQQFDGEGSLVSVVSDSYDLWHAIDRIWGEQLKTEVENFKGTLVIRPDSGDPVDVVCRTMGHLIDKFGATTNSKGYLVLPKYLRIIQGDGVNLESIETCLAAMKSKGYSADNIAFGMGGALLQKCNRDSLRFAMKADAIKRDGKWYDVYKQPVTDSAKASKRGRLALVRDQRGNYHTIRLRDLGERDNQLIPIYKDGQLLKDWRLNEVRASADRCGELALT